MREKKHSAEQIVKKLRLSRQSDAAPEWASENRRFSLSVPSARARQLSE